MEGQKKKSSKSVDTPVAEEEEVAPTQRQEPRKLDERKIKAFTAIVNFVNDLSDVFGSSKKVTPLSLYNRLVVKHIKFTDINRIDEAIAGFNTFFVKYGDCLIKQEWDKIPRDTIISYGTSESICLEIQKYLHQAGEEDKKVIRQHLLTIQAIIRPADNNALLQELEKIPMTGLPLGAPGDLKAALKIDENTNEGRFISGIMNKTKEAMEGMDTSNPTTALLGLAQSGIVQDLIGGLQNGVANGQMDMGKLLQTMTGALQAFMPQPQQPAKPTVEEIKDADKPTKK